ADTERWFYFCNVFPAPAGINRIASRRVNTTPCVPRASGDKPAALLCEVGRRECSPRQRG
ncbi:hypothetical protein ACXMRQ_005004, partial [Shigella boydii]